ncbi:uncharacterized protein LOC125229856 [Leguminivora glycinivorella]|uniref:uncharacterized protein LOC125229856 n=1 Tax=Leguminivora glycinivorella TaxID=1035111 RepID=UPI00200DAEBF|nr:uncharacterized protein LOC125229856 [Leguminivora glycinivorella]
MATPTPRIGLDPEMSFEETTLDTETPPNYEYVNTDRLLRHTSTIQTNIQPMTITSEQFNEFKDEMRKLITYFNVSQQREIAGIKTTLSQIQQSNQNIESSINSLQIQNEEFRNQISQLESHMKDDREYILFLENKLEEMQTGCRKTNFEIKNVPKKDNETKQDLIEMVTCLSETIDCKISKSDIKDIYRVRGKRTEVKNTPIVIETNSVLIKSDFCKMAKSYNIKNKTKLCAKHLGFKTQEDTPVFLSEHLTPKASRLHFLARDLARSKHYKFCWTSYGKVYVRKDEQAPVILIRSEEQVHRLLQED